MVAGTQQGGDIDVKRGVGLGAAKQHAHGAHALEHAVGWSPGAALLEQVQADLARLQTDVGVNHGRRERDLRRLQRVRRGYGYAEEPATFCVARRTKAERLAGCCCCEEGGRGERRGEGRWRVAM